MRIGQFKRGSGACSLEPGVFDAFLHFGAISSQLRLVVYLDKCKDFESKLPNDTSSNLNAWLSKTCRVQDIAADMPVTKECKDRTNNEDAQRICMNLSDVWSIAGILDPSSSAFHTTGLCFRTRALELSTSQDCP